MTTGRVGGKCSPMGMRFSKYHGLGNDFVVVDGGEADAARAEAEAIAICDRHLGVGADGVLIVTHGEGGPHMRVINADGSRPEMCGNGLRCVALHLHRSGAVEGRSFDVQTDAGPHRCDVLSGEREGSVRVAMRAAALDPGELGIADGEEMRDAVLAVGGSELHVTAVSMGNPHAVVFDDVGPRMQTLGPTLTAHAHFAQGVNAGFARLVADGRIELAVHERGAGWTRACGTGACAAGVAAVETGRAARNTDIEVQLPGGPLSIRVGPPGTPVMMTGPAQHVFDGER